MRVFVGLLMVGALGLSWTRLGVGFGGGGQLDLATLRLAGVEASVLPDETGFVLSGLPAALLDYNVRSYFRVVAVESDGEDLSEFHSGVSELPSTMGEFSVQGQRLTFVPRYPLVSGLEYRILLSEAGSAGSEAAFGGTVAQWRVRVPDGVMVPVAVVRSVLPLADVLPENHLKFYIEFSHPMRPWEPYAYLSLIDEDTGEVLPDVFLTAHAEMWDPTGTRFTLLFDPGRIKRGLQNNSAFGPPLREGGHYRLVVSEAWPDAQGVVMRTGFEKRFRVGPADRRSPDPTTWTLGTPHADSTDRLAVEFGELLDPGYLEHAMRVLNYSGTEVGGVTETHQDSAEWRFVPDAPWQPGSYTLEIDARLEDLAGNNLNRLFDMDLEAGESLREQPVHLVRFTVR